MSENPEKMSEKKLTCVMCPLGCAVTVRSDEFGNITEVIGAGCKKGEAYAKEEVIAPMRVLTTTIPIAGAYMGRLPVRSSGFIPRDRILDCIRELKKMKIKKMYRSGDIVVGNILGLGVDIIATKDLI